MAGAEIPDIPGLRRLGENKEEGRIEIGPEEPYFAPINRFNMLSQVRKSLDEEELRELTDALIVTEEGDRQAIRLLQPVTAGRQLIEELKESGAGDQVDSFTQSLINPDQSD